MISIIVNVYNGEKYIRKCLDSIVRQTYRNIEIVVVDDGSVDNTVDICRSYNDSRMKIISGENKGLSLSRNIGIENSVGEYLYFVDSDDYIELDTIEYLYNLALKYHSDITTCESIDVYDYDTRIVNKKCQIQVIKNTDMLKKVLLSNNRHGTTWNKLIKRELFNNTMFEDGIVNDVCVTYKLIIKAKKIVYSNSIKYYYYRHRDSIMGKNKEDRLIDLYEASIERYHYINERFNNMIENDICLLVIIITMYNARYKKIDKYMKDKGLFSLYKKLFKIKMLNVDMNNNYKIKMILFRINPLLYRIVISNYLFIKFKILKIGS